MWKNQNWIDGYRDGLFGRTPQNNEFAYQSGFKKGSLTSGEIEWFAEINKTTSFL